MRLLELKADGTVTIDIFHPNYTPRYAILSHTWGAEEVTFQDILNGTGKYKPGYSKVQFCGHQAAADGLRYFWIDCCCIDKSSSAELSEAINSMFRWFSEAAVCYVYLSDVNEDHINRDYPLPQSPWEPSFRKSRWFTRGWTLQELIAPRQLVFFTHAGTRIGTKTGLATIISEVTGIPGEVLTNLKRPDEYSVAERMAWASRRSTTLTEDKAYCLMGLFGINMPPLYGEGDLAFQRLQKEIMSLTNQASGLRLLVVDSSPLMIETFANHDEPDYTILSHTWKTDEVSFQDILVGKAPGRRGYDKIKKCCEKAKSDGYKYLWVDTCCIDKTSSAELQEAICSMFNWYKNARICYVYLEDYEPWSSPPSRLSSCKWFKRGWTLQELIAPFSVKFYDSKWNEFGTKASLCQQIAHITGIDPLILRGASPATRTVAERMSWASGRSTSRIEDAAYSLMGLFNVYMPMLYGEGDRAFIRLQEEIMKQSEDYTIFAWKCRDPKSRQRGLLARSPSEFISHMYSKAKVPESLPFISQYTAPDQRLHNPAVLTSRGLLIALPLLMQRLLRNEASESQEIGRSRGRWIPPFRRLRGSSDGLELRLGLYLALICRLDSGSGKKRQILCIWLQNHPGRHVFTRVSPGSVVLLPEKRASDFEMHTIYVLPSGAANDDIALVNNAVTDWTIH